METTGTNYNPNQMIELRKIQLESGDNTYAYYKATELEAMLWADPTIEALESLPNGDVKVHKLTRSDISEIFRKKQYTESWLERANSTIARIINNLNEEGWYSSHYEKSEILDELCDILDHKPTKTIEFSGSISFSGSVEVPLSEAEEFELESEISDAINIESYHRGDVEINDWSIDYINEE